MDTIRKILLWLRKKFETEKQKWFLIFGIIFLVSTISAFIIDRFLPMGSWWNFLRTIVLIPLSSSFFCFTYFSVKWIEKRRDPESAWIPLRERFSVAWRQRIAIVAAAILLVIAYAVTGSQSYTFMSSLVFAGFFSLLVFIRKTKKEDTMEKLGIIDPRDISETVLLEKIKSKREKEEEKKKEDGLLGIKGRLKGREKEEDKND